MRNADPTPTDLGAALAQAAEETTDALDRLLPIGPGAEARLHQAMRYAALGPGKRLRAFLALETARLHHVGRASALRVAAAIEMVHAYSLVHDDLPAMDDAAMRRGKASTHIEFDEATAILAGDALLTRAFEVLAEPATHGDPQVRLELIAEMARAAGPVGMCGGQMADLMAEREPVHEVGAVIRLQRMKTGEMIALSCVAGGILGKAPQQIKEALRGYAHDLGLAFQIADDLLDVAGSAAETGKDVAKDAAAGKATFVSILGVEGARQRATLLAEQACRHLDPFGPQADLLRKVAVYVVDRRR